MEASKKKAHPPARPVHKPEGLAGDTAAGVQARRLWWLAGIAVGVAAGCAAGWLLLA
jgi:hypothetical protein